MDKDDVLGGLATVRLTLGELSRQTWCPKCKRWETESEAIIDALRTVEDAIAQGDVRRVLRWIEFNLPEGPQRRERLREVLHDILTKVKHIEHGHPRDVFKWAREDINAAAARAAEDMVHTADYIKCLEELIEGAPPREPSRLSVNADTYVVTLDGEPYSVAPDVAEFFAALVTADGDRVAASRFLTKPKRSLDKLPKPLKDILASPTTNGYRLNL